MEIDCQNKRNQILSEIQLVINGCSKDLNLSNNFSSWKNTAKGLDFIKEDHSKFKLGINLWIKITQDQILGISNIEDLQNFQVSKFPWIKSFINIYNYNNQFN